MFFSDSFRSGVRSFGTIFTQTLCTLNLQCKICLVFLCPCPFLSFQQAPGYSDNDPRGLMSQFLQCGRPLLTLKAFWTRITHPSLNVLNHPKTCVRDEHSFPYRYTAFNMAYASMANFILFDFPDASPDHLTRHISDASQVQTLVRSTPTINLSVPLACLANSGWEKLHQTQSCSKIVQHAPCLLAAASVRLFNSHTSYMCVSFRISQVPIHTWCHIWKIHVRPSVFHKSHIIYGTIDGTIYGTTSRYCNHIWHQVFHITHICTPYMTFLQGVIMT